MKVDIKDKILADAPLGYALHQIIKDNSGIPCDFITLDINTQTEAIMGRTASEIIGNEATSFLPGLNHNSFDLIQTFANVAYQKQKVELTRYSNSLHKWLRIIAYSPEKGYFVTLLEDVTSHKEVEKQYFEMRQVVKRQENIIDIYNINISDRNEFLAYALRVAQKMMESQYGYIFLYDEENRVLIPNTWAEGALLDPDLNRQKEIDPFGNSCILGEVIRRRKPVIVNDPHLCNPKGPMRHHVRIENYMSIPVFFNDKIVATVGLAGKKDDYTDFDANELTLLMQSAWFIKETKAQIEKNEKERKKYDQILNKMPVLFCELDADGKFIYVNKTYCDYYGLDKGDFTGKHFLEFVSEEEQEAVNKYFLSLTREKPSVQYIRQIKRGNETRWMEWQDAAVFNGEGKRITCYSMGWDVTDGKLLEMKEREELAQFRSAIDHHGAIIFFIDPESWEILYANEAAERFYGYRKDELLKMNLKDINMLGLKKLKMLQKRAVHTGQQFYTFPHRLKNGEIRMVDVFSSLIDYGRKKVFFAIIFDVTEKENAMAEIKHLAYYDALTGVYNRRYFEETFARIDRQENRPLAIIMGDINGMKMVNDNFGHKAGDALIKEAAQLIKDYIPKDSVLARVGGDEFVVLIPKATEKEIEQTTDILENELEKDIVINHNDNLNLYLSMSFGYALQGKTGECMDALIKKSESYVYKRKYYNQRSMRSHMIQAMMSTLFGKSEREQKHSERVGSYCEAIAKALFWESVRINEIKVAGDLHDIGKISIDEHILNKEGKLNDVEWKIMKQHPKKSAMILGEIEEYKDIVSIVGAHHERIDGTGYPNGLKGNEIPIEARIISVADAFDAMTAYRTYRDPKSEEDAITELYRCAGTQFDPHIVDVFVHKVLLKDLNEEKEVFPS